jgi:hypothetical protein
MQPEISTCTTVAAGLTIHSSRSRFAARLNSGVRPAMKNVARWQLVNDFLAFREQCIWLQTCYNTYRHLYESGQDSLDLMDRTASVFFHDLNTILIEYCWLQIGKITDPAVQNGRDNLSVLYIDRELEKQGLLTSDIRKSSSAILHYRDLTKDGRNRIVAHHDKETVFNAIPVGSHSQQDVASFFNSLYEYVDSVGNAVGVGPLDFKTTAAPGDTLDLLKSLRRV